MAAPPARVEDFFALPSPFTDHGGRLDEARRRYPDAPAPWLDLSTGINPHAYPAGAPADARALPGRAALAALEAAAADAFGMRAGSIAALPGSEIGLRLLATIGLPGPFAVAAPGYGTHGAIWPAAARFPAAEAAEVAPAGARTVLLASPNNPDGRLAAPRALVRLARALAERGGVLVVDEAFADAHAEGEAGVLPLLGADDPVLVLRSFGKFYGLAGVRLGFACGHPALVEPLRARLGDWPVSAAAIAAGTAAYRDRGWRGEMRGRLEREAAALDAVLTRHGLSPQGACPLFRLARTPRAPELFAGLAARGILVRPFADAPAQLRLGLPGSDDALHRLDRALDAVDVGG